MFKKTLAALSITTVAVLGLTGCAPATPTLAQAITATDAAIAKNGVDTHLTYAVPVPDDGTTVLTHTGTTPNLKSWHSISPNAMDPVGENPGFADTDYLWETIKPYLLAKKGDKLFDGMHFFVDAKHEGIDPATDVSSNYTIVTSVEDKAIDSSHLSHTLNLDVKKNASITFTLTLKDNVVTAIETTIAGLKLVDMVPDPMYPGEQINAGICQYFFTITCMDKMTLNYDVTALEKQLTFEENEENSAMIEFGKVMYNSIEKGGSTKWAIDNLPLEADTMSLAGDAWAEWADNTRTVFLLDYEEGFYRYLKTTDGIITSTKSGTTYCEGTEAECNSRPEPAWEDIIYPSSKK